MSGSGGYKQRTAFDSYVREIRRLPPDEAFAAASELVETQAAVRAQAADIRAEQALRIWNSESMTVTELGRRLGGISKQRADKLLEHGQKSPGGGQPFRCPKPSSPRLLHPPVACSSPSDSMASRRGDS